MLDTDTKRRIDTARDILVGKVPDPKSQVEQITIALIYKFMDDMDAESEEFGGKRKFFANEFARYGWAKLMHAGLGGHETLNLYAEAIAKMPENPGIPLLFRDIFKNAYLPYRDPETLRAFLKIIDDFNYDHSERLGDAFEYLLSVLGSQGDAGQFRTPRHIIDFMVAIIDPKKTETVLDPACGTAGFLISSWKHILKANSSPLAGEGRGEGATQRTGDLLTPDEKGRLAQNFKGYDISPDMVRLSLVNLYLHGFADPHIYEYDTLTSQDRWNEYADVILANPPFMSPKGGIKPHNRFSVQSKRSEVLIGKPTKWTTDPQRLAEAGDILMSVRAPVGPVNLTTQRICIGRGLAAIRPAEGRLLNSYIFYLLRSLKQEIVGDAGAAFASINRGDIEKIKIPLPPLEVQKEIVAEIKGYQKVIDGARAVLDNYRPHIPIHPDWPMAALGEACIVNPRKSEVADLEDSTVVSFVPMSDIGEHEMFFAPKDTKRLDEVTTSYTYFKDGDVLLAKVTPCFENGKAGITRNLRNGIGFGSSEFYVLRPSGDLLPQWVFMFVATPAFRAWATPQMTGTGGLQRIPRSVVESYEIPLPPLTTQQAIVAEIEAEQALVAANRELIERFEKKIQATLARVWGEDR